MTVFSLIRAIARAMLAWVFIAAGWSTARKPGHRTHQAAALGVPFPELSVRANGVVMMLSGAALTLGVASRLAATILAASLVPTTLAGHPFWQETDPQKRAVQHIHFLKNLSMLGGLTLVALSGSQRRRPRARPIRWPGPVTRYSRDSAL